MELDHEFTVPVPVDQAWSVLLDVERVAQCMPGATLDSVHGEEFSGRMKVKVGAMTITYRGTARIVSADESSHTVTIEAAAKEARGSGTASATVTAQLHEQDGTTHVAVHTKLNVTGRPAQFGRNILAEVGSKVIDRFAAALAEEIEHPATETGPAQDGAPQDGADKAVAASADVVARAAEEKPPGALDEAASMPGTPATAEPEAKEAAAETAEPAAEPAAPAAARAARPVTQARRQEEDAIDLLEVAGPSVLKRAVPALGALVMALLAVRFLLRRRKRS